MRQKLMLGDNMELLKKLLDNSVDSVVSDGPYGLKFMGKKWDYDVPTIEFWKEVYRVLKPGGHVLSFGGTRTYHRMVVAIEDAGFEIRDCISYIYGSGFPKSLNVNKNLNNKNEICRCQENTKYNLRSQNVGRWPICGRCLKPIIQPGLGTALKPAQELVALARKPISEDTIAANVLKWGTGGINIDGCRIKTDDKLRKLNGTFTFNSGNGADMLGKTNAFVDPGLGRFPANIIFDEEAAKMLDDQSGVSKGNKPGSIRKGSFTFCSDYEKVETKRTGFNDQGGSSRFFYCAKVSKAERNMGLDGFEEKKVKDGRKVEVDNAFQRGETLRSNTHPTVKPIKLMSYLCRLITPKNGIVLDPFMGSGSTGIAAKIEGFDFIGMEMDEEYFKIAEARIKNYN